MPLNPKLYTRKGRQAEAFCLSMHSNRLTFTS
jgi:hypothetical protein